MIEDYVRAHLAESISIEALAATERSASIHNLKSAIRTSWKSKELLQNPLSKDPPNILPATSRQRHRPVTSDRQTRRVYSLLSDPWIDLFKNWRRSNRMAYVKPYNIRTTAISPGAVATELLNSITEPDIAEAARGPRTSRFLPSHSRGQSRLP
jgi:hypothetical protein